MRRPVFILFALALTACSGGGGTATAPSAGAAIVPVIPTAPTPASALGGSGGSSTIGLANVATLTKAWSKKLDAGIFGTPVINGGDILVSTMRGISAVNITNGAARWTVTSPERDSFFSPPAVAGNVVYAGTALTGAELFAIVETTGEVMWKHDFGTDFAIYGAPVIIGHTVVVGLANQTEPPCSHGAIVALDTATGAVIWEHDTAPTGSGAAVWAAVGVGTDGSLLAPVGNACGDPSLAPDANSIVALDPQTGEERWRYVADVNDPADPALNGDHDFGASPLVTPRLVVVPNKDGNLYAIDPTSGQLAWLTHIAAANAEPTYGGSICSPAWDGTRIFVGGGNVAGDWKGAFNALDANGRILWTNPTATPVLAAPIVSGGVVFYTDGAALVGADAATGAIAWRVTTPKTVDGSPAISGKSLVVGDTSGTLTAYALH